jgi:signal transduction histidine kinase
MIALRGGARPWMESAEARIRDFTELVATAIANTESRAELAASRARVVAAGDAARRRIERDLHDGTQQRLVSLGIQLRLAESNVPPGHEDLRGQLSRTVRGVTDIVEELQEISRGLHPAVLSRRGLRPALRSLARRSAVPVGLDTRIDRMPDEPVQVAIYYVVSEALTNAAKHARASVVRIDLHATEEGVRLTIADDGVGGADPVRGSGLIGLKDRVEAVGGAVRIASPPGGGTTLTVTIPG